MRELKFDEAGKFDQGFKTVTSGINDDKIRGVATAYKENMERVLSHWELPIHLAALMPLWIDPQAGLHAAYQPVTMMLTRGLWPQQIKASQAQIQAMDEQYAREVGVDIGLTNSNRILKHLLAPASTTDALQAVRGFEAILSAMVVDSWAAFETLTGDLWENCLNARPRLGIVALEAEILPSDDDEEKDRKRKLRYRMPVRLLRKWNYNFQNRMGSLLRGKWDFTRRNEAAEAYVKAFPDHKSDLDAIFQKESLKWLAATRNLLVHRAGVADAEFIFAVQNHPSLSIISEQATIELSGDLVRDLIDPTVKLALELVKFVNHWLSNNTV